MLVFEFIVVYLLSVGQMVVERKVFTDLDTCAKHAEVRVAEILADPKVQDGLFGACVPVNGDLI